MHVSGADMFRISLIALAVLGVVAATVHFARADERAFAGIASFYGAESGTRTASGARFRPDRMTAAHRSLPFGTRLRCAHRGRTVDVTVNDRGPFVRGRVLDLSAGAARVLGIEGQGLGHVSCEIVG